MQRPDFDRMCQGVQPGDMPVFQRMDRFARTETEAYNLIQAWMEQGIRVRILNIGKIENTEVGGGCCTSCSHLRSSRGTGSSLPVNVGYVIGNVSIKLSTAEVVCGLNMFENRHGLRCGHCGRTCRSRSRLLLRRRRKRRRGGLLIFIHDDGFPFRNCRGLWLCAYGAKSRGDGKEKWDIWQVWSAGDVTPDDRLSPSLFFFPLP